jgi:5-methylthioadenosine/S-adenosylhomocysteine deaminase
MQTVDTIIRARWVVPVNPEQVVHEDACVIIDGGRILAIVDAHEGDQYQAAQTHHYPHHALIPGLVNAHTHAAMSLFRGFADDLPLMTWLREHIWPAEARHVNERFVQIGTELAVAEMLLGGTTCFNDMYFFPDVTGRVVEDIGSRAMVGLIVIDAPTAWASDLNDYLAKAGAVHDEFRHSARVRTAFAPHAPYTVSDEGLRRVAVLAHELDVPVHIHLHETTHEVDEALNNSGIRPLARLQELGLLSPRLIAVHMTALNEADIEAVVNHGVHVVHCPESNLKLASGTAPVSTLLEKSVNLALGTDGAASNNDLDMFSEMRTAALVAKGASGDPTSLPAARALTMATLGGATALGLGADIGSLEVGKCADIVAVDLSGPATQPVHNVISALVYAASRDAVTDVWVEGKRVVDTRKITSLDLSRLTSDVQQLASRMRND